MVIKFGFSFNDSNKSLDSLCDFVDHNLELNNKYHVVLSSSDCEIFRDAPPLINTSYMEYTFSDYNSVKLFFDNVNCHINKMVTNIGIRCDCEAYNCFDSIDIYFVKYDISYSDLYYKVNAYEGVYRVDKGRDERYRN